MKKFVRKLIKSALNNAKNDGDLELSIMPEIVVEKPKEEKFGDFSTSLAMGLAKSERRSHTKSRKSYLATFNVTMTI